jgi:fumarate reductase (CoM/CoB) subunit A
MQFLDFKSISCDILVIGGGGAGLRAAIAARERGADVLVVSKTRVGYGNNTFISKAGFAAAGWGDAGDDYTLHVRDTVIGGRFLNDQKLVSLMAREAGRQVRFLEECGVNLRKREGKILLGRTPGHSFPRGIGTEHALGRELILPLRERARRIGVRFADRVFITRLFSSDNRITAASGFSEEGDFISFAVRCVILATGGYAQVYCNTDNVAGITGDGHALAYELGLHLKDIEFVQFYPTATGRFGKRILLYEVFVHYAGAQLKNARGENIVIKHGLDDPKTMTRDRLTRAVSVEIDGGLGVDNGVILDLSPVQEKHLKGLRSFLPSKWTADRKEIIVAPTTHFCMGGVVINERSETAIAGLYAAGEICAGVHGANRLGGNALAEVFALGGVAGRNAAAMAEEIEQPEVPKREIAEEKKRLEFSPSETGEDIETLSRSLKEVMWEKAGVVREAPALGEALRRIEELRSLSLNSPKVHARELRRYLELQNMLLMSEMICRAALMRTESRGSHYRTDYPEEDNINWLKNITLSQEGKKMALRSVPVAPDMTALQEIDEQR